MENEVTEDGKIDPKDTEIISNSNQAMPKRVNNEGKAIEKVFGFNYNAELVNGRVAMIGFLMLLITELIFKGEPVTKTIFGLS